MEKGELIKLMLEYELFEEKIFWSSDSDFFQSYLEFLYLNGGKNDEKDSGNKHSNKRRLTRGYNVRFKLGRAFGNLLF